jgi:hypothetical protein
MQLAGSRGAARSATMRNDDDQPSLRPRSRLQRFESGHAVDRVGRGNRRLGGGVPVRLGGAAIVSGAGESTLDPATVTAADAFMGAWLDRGAVHCVAAAEPLALARAIAAFANARGGDILIGVATDPAGRVVALPGVRADEMTVSLAGAVELLDPPAAHLLRWRTLEAGRGVVGHVHVRLSPSAPHLVTSEGVLYRFGGDGVQPIRSRRTLDDLFMRGRGERERADRLVEAMATKLALGHYAFYSVAVIACTQQPGAEPYRRAQIDRAWLAAPDDRLVASYQLDEHEPHIGPGEVELRAPWEETGYIRITRAGCAAAGVVRRRPYHEELATATALEALIADLATTAARVLAVAAEPLILPHLFIEGVRGLRLLRDPDRRLLSENAPQDTARHPLTIGDARDPAYVAALAPEAMERLAALFP